MPEGVFDARFYVSFGWDYGRKCWVVQARDQKTRKMLQRRDVHTTREMNPLDVKRVLAAVESEMMSWLPW